MKWKKIWIIIILIIVLLFIVASFIVFNKFMSNDKENDSNNKVSLKSFKSNDIIFKDIECNYDGNNSRLSYIMENTTVQDLDMNYTIIFKDSNNDIITTIDVSSYEKLKTTYQMVYYVSVDLTRTKSMEIQYKS